MKIGITQLCVTGTIEEVIAKTVQWGYEVIELGMKTAGGILDMTTTAAAKRDMATAIKDAGLELASLVAGPVQEAGSLFSPDQAVRTTAIDRCRYVIDTAALMGADTILLVPGRLTSEIFYDEAMKLLVESLRVIAPHAEQAGVSVAIEQVWNRFLVTPMDMKYVIEQAASDAVGVYIDTGNMVFWNFPEHWIRILAPHIKKIHFKDFKREGMALKFVPLTEGEVNWPAVMREIRAAGYNGPVISEVGGDDGVLAATAGTMRKIIALGQ